MATVIYGMLKEEKERNLEMQEAYKQELSGLRKGSITEKIISGKLYYYLKYWDGNKTQYDYLGKDVAVVEELQIELNRRKYLQGVLKRLKTEYKEIGRIVKE